MRADTALVTIWLLSLSALPQSYYLLHWPCCLPMLEEPLLCALFLAPELEVPKLLPLHWAGSDLQ